MTVNYYGDDILGSTKIGQTGSDRPVWLTWGWFWLSGWDWP